MPIDILSDTLCIPNISVGHIKFYGYLLTLFNYHIVIFYISFLFLELTWQILKLLFQDIILVTFQVKFFLSLITISGINCIFQSTVESNLVSTVVIG